ncbi:MAG: hypothetical protein U9O94_05540 [Nanoarchaeota archaeon]|nr:hypothetical protein [Nanoarchaeota archaeon]
MSVLEIHETLKKHITVIKKTIIRPSIEAIIAIPKTKENKIVKR